MKTVLLYFLSIGFSALSFAQNGFQKKSIQILPESKLTITGDTNISEFLCAYNTSLIPNTENMNFTGNLEEIRFERAILKLNNKGFDCGNKAINKDFQSLIKSSEYPDIELELKKLCFKTPNKAIALITISIAGKQKDYKVPVIIKENPVAQYVGKLQLDINDFNLTPPKKLFGLIKVKEDIEINFNLIVENSI